ncbi:hypothetical protein RB195_011582 [Necator americanus]
MLNELNEAGKRIGLRINRKKTQFMNNAYCEDGGVQLEGSQIVESPSYVYLGRSMNMENDLKEELNRRMRAAWAAFAAVREATDQLTDQDLRAHLFDSTILPALCYAAETWADTAATSRKLLTTHRALQRCLLKFNRRTQHLAGLRSSDLREMSRLRDPVEYVSKAKHRWAGHVMRRIDDRWTKRTLEWIPRDAKRPRGRPPARWGDAFAARMDQLRAQLDTAQGPHQRRQRGAVEVRDYSKKPEASLWCIAIDRSRDHVGRRRIFDLSNGKKKTPRRNSDFHRLRRNQAQLRKMTTTLYTRQGLLTRACNRLKERLRDQEELLTNAAEIHDGELEQQFLSEHSRQMRQARRTIQAEMDTVEKALEKYSGDRRLPGRTTTSEIPMVPLPPMPIPKFDGKLWEWETFWTAFNHSVHSRDIDDLYKMNYRLNALQGEARACMKQYEISRNTYATVIAHLQEKYGDRQALLDQLLRKLQAAKAVLDNQNRCSHGDNISEFSDSRRQTVPPRERYCSSCGSPDDTDLSGYSTRMCKSVHVVGKGRWTARTLPSGLKVLPSKLGYLVIGRTGAEHREEQVVVNKIKSMDGVGSGTETNNLQSTSPQSETQTATENGLGTAVNSTPFDYRSPDMESRRETITNATQTTHAATRNIESSDSSTSDDEHTDIGSPRGYRTNGKERQDGNDMVLKEFEATIQKKKYGYYVRLPWKKDSADLPDNKAMSFRRLQTIVAKLQKNPELMQQYHNTFMNQL